MKDVTSLSTIDSHGISPFNCKSRENPFKTAIRVRDAKEKNIKRKSYFR